MSSDGQHFALGLATGALVIKSKTLEAEKEEENEEQKLVKNALVSTWVSKSKNYKYFYRGQYQTLMPEDDGILAQDSSRKAKLLPYEQSLKAFKYREALSLALGTKNPEVVLAMLEEMIERGALEHALAGRSEE